MTEGRDTEHQLAHEVLVAAPRPAVWRLVEDAEALKAWVPGSEAS